MRIGIFLGWLLIGGILRIHVVQTAPEEVDENNYLAPAVDFRRAIDRGDWESITKVERNFEHPPLVKFLYSLTLDQAELNQLPEDFGGDFLNQMPRSLENARWQAALAGMVSVGGMTLLNPLAGLVMAIQSMLVYYTGVAYLDALPMMFTVLMAWFYTRQPQRKLDFWLAAVCLGAAAAGKYPFAFGGLIIVIHALFYRLVRIRNLALWGLLALGTFYLLNPYLWTDPIGRLTDQLTFHQDYASGRNYSLHIPWQQMIFPRQDIRYDEGLLLPAGIDVLIFLLAVPGSILLLRQKSVFGWWLVAGMIFLMLWRAQWIQHNMIIAVPYCMSVAENLKWIGSRWIKTSLFESKTSVNALPES
jgi:hypothetical protein